MAAHDDRPGTAALNPQRRSTLKRLGAGGAMLALAATPLRSLAAPEKTRVTLAVGGKATLYYLPLTLTERLGYFRDEGLEVEINDFQGGGKALQALIGGSADVVSGAFEHTITMQTLAQKVQAFVLQGTNPGLELGIAKGKAAAYSWPKDLKGMRVGVSAPGSSTHMFVNHLLASVGLTPDDVSIVGVGTGAGAVAAMRGGQIDALSSVEPVISLLEKSGDIKVVHETITDEGTRKVFGARLPTATTAKSVVFVATANGGLTVTHDYHPSSKTNYLYETDVTIQNGTGADIAAGDLVYRRVMDWDIYPTPFNEYVTIGGVPGALGIANGTNVAQTDNNGFNSANPLSFSSYGLHNVNFTDAGPSDHGALFDFEFNALAAGGSLSFTTYYGATPDEATADSVRALVGMNLYSYGQPNVLGGPDLGQPNTFIFGFGATSGGVLTPAIPEPETYAMMMAGLGVLGAIARRRKAKAA